MANSSLLLAPDEIIVDCFAGGGGASLGIEMATGRSPDVAINHDAMAVAMHEVNHPDAEHFIEDIKDVDPVVVCKGRKVGLLWASPDCTEHSKAKNGAITRDKKVRGLAWIVVDWAKAVRPRVILLENVEEWWDWGPLDEDGKIDKARKGEYRSLWWRRLEAMGYRLSMRVLKACDYGAPTSRKRLFIIARCDEIDPETCWPAATHGPGTDQPYRTAAECIDYSLPCPSIFMTKAEARAFTKKTGIRCKRPLEETTMARIRRGIYKFVLNCARPFIVPVTHQGDHRVHDIDEPMRTVTGANRGELALTQPYLVRYNGQSHAQSLTDPMSTVDCTDRLAYVAPTLVQTGYGERPGQAPRCLDLHAPLGTIIAGGNGSGNGKHALVAAYLYKGFGDENRQGGFTGGVPIDKPISTVTCRDHHQLAVSHLVKMRGTSEAHMNASSQGAETPVPTITANGNHIGEVRAFLTKYHSTNSDGGKGRCGTLFEPIATVDTSNRFGIVYVEGEEYQIADIGMRMLEPRELFRAQGFPDSYIIDPVVTYQTPSGKWKTGVMPKTMQVEKCGNSVCPPIAAALVRAAFSTGAAAVAA
jgi:DNA (cytosine-5)-methyltransferase 1